MNYVVLARKYRPMSFDDLVGQEHVARTLSNAIATGRVAHAFLFTGVRGVGKTTSARILAKALNCMGNPGGSVNPGPTASPCLECSACREIATGADVDVQEIDGASYNGVDEVRRLQDSLPYRPQRDRFKIVIVDEVHMLTQSAWNAFLKTLEEPPPHVKFIFATTEAHKVPITILSRVQRFDFKLIPARMIIARLRHVLGQEKIDADDAALSVIAREAAGSMRDAMSLLDQVIAWGGERLTGEGVARVLGVASRQVLHEMAHGLVTGAAQQCLDLVEKLAGQGYEMGHVSRDLLALLRDLVVAKVCSNPGSLLDLPDEERDEVIRLAANADVNDLVRLHQGFSQGFDDVARSSQPRAALEMLLVRLALRPPLLPLDELLTRIGALERRLSAGSSGTPGGAPGGTGSGRSGAEPRRGVQHSRRASPQRSELNAVTPEVTKGEVLSMAPAVALQARDEISSGSGVATAATPTPQDPPRTGSDPSSSPARVGKEASSSEGTSRVGSSAASETGSTPRFVGSNDSVLAPPALTSPRRGADSSDQLAPPPDDWRAIVQQIRRERPELAAFLSHALPIQVDKGRIVLGWEPGSLFLGPASGDDEQRLLAAAAEQHFGAKPLLSFQADYSGHAASETVASLEAREREHARLIALERARRHPLVRDAIEVLGGRVREIRLPET